MKRDHTVQNLFAAAAIFILLGAGNLYFGLTKLSHYEQLLSRATQELATSDQQSQEEIIAPSKNVEQQTRFINRIKTRISFYSLVTLGGRCFLALAGVCLLGILLKRSISPNDDAVSP